MLSALLSGLMDTCSNNNLKFKLENIDPYLREVPKYCRNSNTLADARELVPISEIIEDKIDILDDVSEYQDNMLPLIIDWYKTKFFSWFEPPECEKCNSKLNQSKTYLNSEQKRVEVYKCNNDVCNYEFEFIRHSDPAILLHTRTGRCGEWAICFLIVLRALDYDTRIVFDSTDHVWNEVWSEPKKCWIHVDPCEGVVDSPLLYEAGWKKKLAYCLAFSQYEVLDVTARYVCDYTSTLSLRELCEEEWLRKHLDEVTKELLMDAPSDEVRNRVKSRRSIDIKHLERLAGTIRDAPTNLHGRRTGGIRWRLERGEYSLSCNTGITIKAISRADSIGKPLFEFIYRSDGDSYECSDNRYNSNGWSSLVYEYENIDYKYESDWKTSYLSRYETCSASTDGRVTWKFDLTELKSEWRAFELLVGGKVFPNTAIELQIHKYESCESKIPIDIIEVPLNERTVSERNDCNIAAIALTAKLSGGQDDDPVGWQKPQLFRQTRGQNERPCCFSLKIL